MDIDAASLRRWARLDLRDAKAVFHHAARKLRASQDRLSPAPVGAANCGVCPDGTLGKWSVTLAPRPNSLAMALVPPCPSPKLFTIHRPTPAPPDCSRQRARACSARGERPNTAVRAS